MKIRSKKKKKIIRKIVTITVFILVIAGTYLLGRNLPRNVADWYSSEAFPSIAAIPQRISSLTAISLTEITTVVLGCLILPLLIFWLVMLVKKTLTRGIGRFLYKSLRNVLAFIMVCLILFEFLHGFNYRRTPARSMLGLGTKQLDLDDYFEAFEWAYQGMIKARSELEEDEKGVAKMSSDFEETSGYASYVVDSFCASYKIAKYKCPARAKSVRLSHYWSWTYIVGTYNLFYGEANVNTDFYDATSIPTTTCHELCHAKGFANETDCNLIGAFACISSERADFRYSGYFTIYFALLNEITKLSKQMGFYYDTHISAKEFLPVARDYMAYVNYWKSIDEEVAEVQKKLGINITEQALAANNKFLESNGEKGGNETYNVPENEYVDFYLKYIAHKGGSDA